MPHKSSDPGNPDPSPVALTLQNDPPDIRAELLDNAFYESNMRRFTAAAYSFVRARFNGRVPNAIDATDVLSAAILKILDGTRRCPDDVESIPFVIGVIRSEASHSGDPLEHRRLHHSISTVPDQDGNIGIDEAHIADPRKTASAEDASAARELALEFMGHLPERYRRYTRLLASETCRTAAERARALGVPINEVRNMDKLIRRMRPLWKG
jgi:DNA-directed RNA polymerase specialized sigma24 family protein